MIADQQQLLVEQQAQIEKEQLHFSGRIWHELLPKVRPSLFRTALRPQIDLSKYGEGITKYYFTFVAMELTPNFEDWVGVSYSTKHRRAEVAIELPYHELIKASDEEVIKLMEKAYLEGINNIADLNLSAPFDYKAFKADVEAIFAEENWYETEDTPA